MDHATPAVLILIAIFIAPVLYYISQAKKGLEIYIRRIQGIDAIDDVVGRSVELGRPLSFTTGISSVGPLLYACLGALRYIGRKAAVFSHRLIVPCSDPEVLVLCDATLQNSYVAEKKFSQYDPSLLRFLSADQFAYASGYQGLIHRENVGGAFLFGSFAAESLILAEAGQQIGALQVAATTSAEQVPFFITACDYTLIGEELYAAGAYLSQDPVQVGSLRGQDMAKLFIAFLVLLGVAQATENAMRGNDSKPAIQSWITRSWSDLFGQQAKPEANSSEDSTETGGA